MWDGLSGLRQPFTSKREQLPMKRTLHGPEAVGSAQMRRHPERTPKSRGRRLRLVLKFLAAACLSESTTRLAQGLPEVVWTNAGSFETPASTPVTFSPDSRAVATPGNDGTIKLWRLRDGRLVWSFGLQLGEYNDGPNALAISPDGTLLASGGGGYHGGVPRFRLVIRSLADGSIHGTPVRDVAPVWSVAFSPDGKLLASGGAYGPLKLWRVADTVLLTNLYGHGSYITRLGSESSTSASASCARTAGLQGENNE
jgi:WD40 repeat protein